MRLSYWRGPEGLVHVFVIRWQVLACKSLELEYAINMDDGLVPTCLMCIARVPIYERIAEAS